MSGINEFKSILDTTLTNQSNDMCDVELNGKEGSDCWRTATLHKQLWLACMNKGEWKSLAEWEGMECTEMWALIFVWLPNSA